MRPYISAEFVLSKLQGLSTSLEELHVILEQLKISEENLKIIQFILAEMKKSVFLIKADGSFSYVNEAAYNNLGFSDKELLSMTLFDINVTLSSDSWPRIWNQIKEQSSLKTESIFRNKVGEEFIVEICSKYFKFNEQEYICAVACELTKEKHIKSVLQNDIYHDFLTGLPNRILFMDSLKEVLKLQQQYPDRLFGLLLIDIDRFKIINDSFGHSIGDQLLIALGSRLEKCKHHTDTLARLGGDEFVILLKELKNQNEAKKIAQDIQEILKKPFVLNNQELFISTSIGITFSSSRYYNQAEQLLRDAHTAMYEAKNRGKSCYTVFDISMHNDLQRQFRLKNDLQGAIERQEIVVYYQPIYCLKNNCLEGIEALARWKHPELGLVYPADFIPLAEEIGIITELDQWVLRNACHQLFYWQNQFPDFSYLTLSVNLSGNQFLESDFIEKIDNILTETGLEGKYLKLEITESILIKDSNSVAQMLNQLRDKKIQVCVDDFGTGYSSLSYLNRFPFNVLKIDRSFINNLSIEDSKSAIVRAIVVMARELGIEVIVEGVETIEQINFIKTLGCFRAQGYWFSHPLDSKEMTHLLKNPLPSLNTKWCTT